MRNALHGRQAMTTARRVFLFLLSLPMVCALVASATDRAMAESPHDPVWNVDKTLIGKDKDKNGGKSTDASGIACIESKGFPRKCLVIDDELQAAQIVIVEEGQLLAGDTIRLIDDTFDGKPIEFDGEGVAYADGAFLIVGSHGHPRDKKNKLDPTKDAAKIEASIRASSRIVQVRIDPNQISPKGKLKGEAQVRAFTGLPAILAAEPRLAPFLNRRLDQNGLTIEGIAALGDRLFVGLRGPSLGGDRAAIVSMPVKDVLENRIPKARLHLVPLGPGRGVRDLAASPSGLLVLAGPTAEGEGSSSIYRVKDEEAELLGEVPPLIEDGEVAKPEALLFLDQNEDGQRVLVLSDGAIEGAPRPLRIRR
ncbi:DUF3616 domain-containing protein [Methylobacterium currus]|uniref:DUF3616 domain-containing protein n=1 Tax=Methylobacterium currus TaxID=2051553 RepID=UPI001E446075|nr:DUF3616 domain-containing protein [Methylobacterium currus]UHC18296.1 DUF3616 domain-containing protein [Methylobacterium currus]